VKESTIRKSYKITSLISLVVLVIVSILLIYYFTELKKNEHLNEKIGNATRIVNTMVSSLNSLKVMAAENAYGSYEEYAKSPDVSLEIARFEDEIKRFLDELNEFDFGYQYQTIGDFPKRLFETGDERKYITEIGDMAREINTYLTIENKTIHAISFFITLSSFILLILIIVILIISFYFQENHFKIVQKTLKNMNMLMDGKSLELIADSSHDSELFKSLKEIEKKIQFQNQLLEYDSFGTLETLLPEMYPILKKQLDMQRMAVAFVDNNENVIAETLISDKDKIVLKAGFKEPISKTTLGKLKTEDDIRIINDLPAHYKNVNQSKATKRILNEGFLSSITAPIYTERGLLGFLFINNVKRNAYDEVDAQIVRQFTKILKSEIYNSYLMQELVAKTSEAFADLVEKKDNETGNHLIRVASYSKMIAEKMMINDKRITPKMIREILWFAPLHDIGKVGIPDNILLKPGKLTDVEFEEMKKHVDIGMQVIHKMNQTLFNSTNIHFLDVCLEIIAEHHEKWNGKGYPKGLKGEEISIPGRIIAVADVFDALISKRVYKAAFSVDNAFEIIQNGRGEHFCPEVVDAFLSDKQDIFRIIEKYKD